ncbi:metal ABC transporter substrate-binding protein [Aeromicrobium duanguangcaii]|uniref:Zinc ABC transporter substrate-binding protein n=1 Tax=Aeromicrobium duanguangcaii TaxID=2968086 RepID=A0ABY5KLD2_9ACTN|nr:zinc ABC transporter substrate-binding protein [Aeromicrobium duanguangcaii]MCD9152927.1 zinc ABC transporter substrate-binding protein [Aeromicrobium duanguangcaii]UUI69967.1 zinc ABC transporter substrate-binding protein [Aeromicrobium duanguangcaii]
MKRLPLVAAACLAAGLSLTACGTEAKDDGRTQVVASFYPAAFLAERVGGDDVQVTTLTSPGVEAHDLELTAKQVVKVNEADVVVYLDHFQPAVDKALEDADRPADTTVNIAAGVPELHEGEDADEHEDDHGHGHGGDDPHVWLDPENMITAAGHVRDALIAADPERRDEFEANTDALVAELEELNADFTTGLADCERDDFVTSHAAFAYLAHAYDLEQIAISGIDPTAEPSSAALAEITDLVKRDGITTIFTERLASSALAETVARETGVTTAVLDPIEGLSDETADEDYVSLMRQNLAALQKANGCA